MVTVARYGWKPDKPDFRDRVYATRATALPVVCDHRDITPSVCDQGQLGSCTGNAIAKMAEYMNRVDALGPKWYGPMSRLFIYWNERNIEGTVSTDSGAEIRDGLKVLAQFGVCPETLWPYSDQNLPIITNPFQQRPIQAAFDAAKQDVAIQYSRLDADSIDPSVLQTCLAQGYPFVFGFTVYTSFESAAVAKTGIVPMPTADDSVLGGHAVMCIGYDQSRQAYIVQNSWGTSWGDNGFFYLPFEYMHNANLVSDIWTVRVMR